MNIKKIKIDTEQAIPEPFSLVVNLLVFLLGRHYEKYNNLPVGFKTSRGRYPKVLKGWHGDSSINLEGENE